MSRKILAIILIAFTVSFNGCRSSSNEQSNDTVSPVYEEGLASNQLKSRTASLVNRIEKSLEGQDARELLLPGNFNSNDIPVRIWRSKDGDPVKIALAVANDGGEFTNEFKFYFLDGQLFYSDQLFARYIFDEENLLYWLDENWNINDIPEEFFNNRNEYIRQTVSKILELNE